MKNGKLECFWGDDRWLLPFVPARPASPAPTATTVACGFKTLRHEGKLTGLAAYGEPNLADRIGRAFRSTSRRRVIETDSSIGSRCTRFIRRCRQDNRETIAASIQKVPRTSPLQSVRCWPRHGARRLGVAGGLFANVRLNRLLAESLPLDEVFIFPAMGDDGLPVGGRCASCCTRATAPRPGSSTASGSTTSISAATTDGTIDATLQAAGVRRLGGRPVETAVDRFAPARSARSIPAAWNTARALGARSIIANPSTTRSTTTSNKRLARSEFMPFAPYRAGGGRGRVFDVDGVNAYAAAS